MITIICVSFIGYKNISQNCYTNDGKTLNKVIDQYPYLRISAKCETIESRCFYQLNSLIGFSLEENPNLKRIGMDSFSYCSNLAFINLSTCSKLTDISWDAFENCKNVKEILLPTGLLNIGSNAFSNIILVTNITIPVTVRKIEGYAFQNCSNLEYVFFEEGSNLEYIGAGSFVETAITSFQIPENVETINGAAFDYDRLTNLTIHPKNKYLIIENHCIYSNNRKTLFAIFNKSIESFEVPNYITKIGEFCFF